MALVVEDGTAVSGADSYITLAAADTYFTNRRNDTWDFASDAEKEVALRKAMDFMEQRWGNLYKGQRKYPETQLWSFPRSYLYDREGYAIEGIPTKLQYAQAEYAVIALENDLWLTPETNETGQQVSRERNKIGPLETDTEYASGGAVHVVKKWPTADAYMREYVTPAQRLVRM